MLAFGECGFADSDIRALRRYLSRILKNSADVEDVIQDAYLRVLEYTDDGPHIDNPLAFLHRIAGNLAIDNIRRRRRTSLICTATGDSEDVEERAQNVCSPHDAEDSLEHDQILQAVLAALAQLPPKCSLVYRMSCLEEHTHREIAVKVGLSVSMIEKYVLRARRHVVTQVAPAYRRAN
jgi:RNA polymerase sigma factor (sigma-70 family)